MCMCAFGHMFHGLLHKSDESYSRNDDAIGHKQAKVVVLDVMTTISNVPKLI